MKKLIITLVALIVAQALWAQEEEHFKFYLGVSYGTSFTLGNFADKDVANADAGFAENGSKVDLFGGYYLNEKFTLVGVLRYQVYDTDISNIVTDYNAQNPGVSLTAESENWQTFYCLVGAAYKVKISRKFAFYPRAALGPLVVSSPEVNGVVTGGNDSNVLTRSAETGVGLGFEIGIGLRTNLGKRFTLMPTYDFSGGFVSIADVQTNNNNNVDVNDYSPSIRSFNVGLSVAYRFY